MASDDALRASSVSGQIDEDNTCGELDGRPNEMRYMQTYPLTSLALAIAFANGHPLFAGETAARGNQDRSPVFASKVLFAAGHHGYKCYRIPALVRTKRGTILAFCEARKHSGADHGDIDLVLRRSADGGRTWTDMQFVADDGANTMGNPCPVLDRSTGVIWLPFCRNNKQVLLTRSSDDGRSWSKPVDITRSVKDAAWPWVGTGPGHGIQLRSGRLIVPCWADHTQRLGECQFSFVFYSDDHGQTWTRGKRLDLNASDECEVVELTDGTLYMNMRSRQGKRQRAYATSKDGGKTWSAVEFDPNRPEPSCQGSLIRLTGAKRFKRNRVLIATPANPKKRTHMTVRLSYDACRTWPVAKVVHEGSSAYSDLAMTSDGQILLLYEADDYTKIVLASFNLEWLTDGKDALP
jgi:sialidase-1